MILASGHRSFPAQENKKKRPWTLWTMAWNKMNFLEYHQQETASPPEKPASYSGL